MEVSQELPEPLLYTVDEAACIISVSPPSLRRMMKDGTVKTIRPRPGMVRISRAELESFVKELENKCQGTQPSNHPDSTPRREAV